MAETILALELPDTDLRSPRLELEAILDQAIRTFGSTKPLETEDQRARRFFLAVDATLIERGYIFPPHGLVELLHHALRPRDLSDAEFSQAITLPENERRVLRMKAMRAEGRPFHLADCDLAAVVYLGAAERLGLPVSLVWVPNHMFVRWSTPTLSRNWDPNLACSVDDATYAEKAGVTAEGRALCGWLDNMTRERVVSYWLSNIGHWHQRHDRSAAALASHQQAVAIDPTNLEAANSLAWFLATARDPAFRDGEEATTIASRLVALASRALWLETLAAARAECGDFSGAVRIVRSAGLSTASGTGDLLVVTTGSLTHDLAAIYAGGITYRQAVDTALIFEPREPLAYDE